MDFTDKLLSNILFGEIRHGVSFPLNVLLLKV